MPDKSRDEKLGNAITAEESHNLLPEDDDACCSKPNRRTFLRMASAGALAAVSPLPVMAGPFEATSFDVNIPEDKKLTPEWVHGLFERGTPETFTRDQIPNTAMPVSGVGAGHVYLTGDGLLTDWRPANTRLVLAQGFAIRTTIAGQTKTLQLIQKDFPTTTFRGEFPIAKVDYQYPDSPLRITLEAFTPFIPHNTDDSGLPATVLHFTLRNTTDKPLEATLLGHLQNGAVMDSRFSVPGTRRNQILTSANLTTLHLTADPLTPDATAAHRLDILFEDWSKPAFQGWTVEGTAFGPGPIERTVIEKKMGKLGGDTTHLVSSYFPSTSNAPTGSLTSAPFTIDRSYINVWIGGGDLEGKTAVRLLVDGKEVASQTGARDNHQLVHYIDARPYNGKQATLQILDNSSAEWGNISVGRITFSDNPGDGIPLAQHPDYGSMALALLGPPAEITIASTPDGIDGPSATEAHVPISQPLTGALGRTLTLAPAASAVVSYVVTWHFPNLTFSKIPNVGRYYNNHYKSAQEVAQYVAANLDSLTTQTRLWRDTWYDSTLPYWFLDRTFLNVSTLGTSGCYRFADGRFYAWEGGPGCCDGTCTHVWQYAHSMSRVFPALERDTRQRVDLGISFTPETGVMGFRGEYDMRLAVDGQAGTLLRIYREHLMSPDQNFLGRNWSRIKLAYNPLFALDANEDGILEGAQMNTLDRPWFGQISWMSSMYVAALLAGVEMADEMNDHAFASRCRRIAEAGSKNIPARLFNGEYFFNIVDPAHLDTVNSGDGSHIDQVYGQSWAFQVGLPRVLPQDKTRSALRALWKYNFSPDAGAYFTAHKEGRKGFVQAGDAGMIICTFPRPDWDYVRASGVGTNAHGFAYYFNETWTGNEYQVAGHMIWEGMLLEGLAMVRAIHDRYNPLKRNPYNEVECGDHYSRAMASHGPFLAICGFEYHGPKGHIAFAPRLKPENFRAPFTTAEGWGTYNQAIQDKKLSASLDLKYGTLKLSTVQLTSPGDHPKVKATLNGKSIRASVASTDGRHTITFAQPVVLAPNQKLTLELA
jgi:non-lysosomal glucosylceramidase